MLDASTPAQDVSEELSSLSKKICDHFADEEAAMRSFAVPQAVAEAHGKEHDRILSELVSLHEAKMLGKRPNLVKLCTMAETWILRHREEYDRPFSSLLQRLTIIFAVFSWHIDSAKIRAWPITSSA